MDRRETYKLVTQLLPRAGGAAGLLDRAADLMRGGADADWDVLHSVLRQDDALGHLYQAINAPALEAAYRGTARERRKFTAAEIPAVTQLFTPKWVVEFLLQNSLGKLWLDANPHSPLRDKWTWMANQSDSPAASAQRTIHADQIRVCDPACGTMNFGLVAIDMLRDIHREQNPSRDLADIDSAIIRYNLVGFDIDPTAIDLARRSLEVKLGRAIAPDEHRLFVCDALFKDKFDEPFDVVVTNPPYLSARNLDPAVVRRLKGRYPAAWRDLYACFILRALQMLQPGGRAGILAMQSFMFTSAFEAMRREIHQSANVESVAHFGPGLFDIGNPGTLQTVAMVLQRKPATETDALFFRLADEEDKHAALARSIQSSSGIELSQSALTASPRGAWMYWIAPAVRRAFTELPRLGQIAPPRQGLATTDNQRFVRYWWEVEPPGYSGPRPKWKPYAKGGRFRRWYESARHRVNWQDDGREIKTAIVERYPYLNGQWQWVAKNSAWYGREGITYSYLTSGNFSARWMEAGTIFDVAGSSLFPEDRLGVLGVLNSSAAREFLAAINPTVNFQVGDLRQLPMPREFPDELREEVSRAIECTRQLDSLDETSPDFQRPEHWNERESIDLLHAAARTERTIDQIVAELYGLEPPASMSIAIADTSKGRLDLARRWIGYALGIWLGRWDDAKRGDVAIFDQSLFASLREILAERTGGESADEIIAEAGGLDRFFARDFWLWHHRLYRDRPIFWGFSANGRMVAVSASDTGEDILHRAFGALGETLPMGWRRCVDDGIRINLAPLRQWIAEKKLRDSLAEEEEDLRAGRLGFSQTATRIAINPE